MVAAALRDGWAAHQRERGLAGTTVRRRDAALAALEAFAPLERATPDDVRALLASRDIGPKATATLLSHLGCFYRWAIREELVETDPTVKVGRPRLPPHLPRPISEDDYALALDAAWDDPVMLAMLLLAGMGGLRCCELARLSWTDVDLARRTIWVTGKGGGERVVPLHPVVADHLADMPRTAAFVCASRRGKRSASAVCQAVNRFLRLRGITATAHQLRHRAATVAYATSQDLLATKLLLGHRQVTTTELYVDLQAEAVRHAAEAMPLPAPPAPALF